MMDSEKTKVIRDWPIPSSIHQLQRFLGFINFYRRFIENFSKVGEPLFKLLQEGQKFVWESDQQMAFQALWNSIDKATILGAPHPSKPFTIETDASDTSLGCILSQTTDNRLVPIAFHSRTLTSAERNYPVYEKEALAILVGLKKWRHYLQDSKKEIRILTDHKNIEALKSSTAPSGRLARWALNFSMFKLQIE